MHSEEGLPSEVTVVHKPGRAVLVKAEMSSDLCLELEWGILLGTLLPLLSAHDLLWLTLWDFKLKTIGL